MLGRGCEFLGPTFVDCGVHDLVAMRVMAAHIRQFSTKSAALLGRQLRRYVGDMALLGKGEILTSDTG
jgi:formylmethanofuran dehydrogenase subunit C